MQAGNKKSGCHTVWLLTFYSPQDWAISFKKHEFVPTNIFRTLFWGPEENRVRSHKKFNFFSQTKWHITWLLWWQKLVRKRVGSHKKLWRFCFSLSKPLLSSHKSTKIMMLYYLSFATLTIMTQSSINVGYVLIEKLKYPRKMPVRLRFWFVSFINWYKMDEGQTGEYFSIFFVWLHHLHKIIFVSKLIMVFLENI